MADTTTTQPLADLLSPALVAKLRSLNACDLRRVENLSRSVLDMDLLPALKARPSHLQLVSSGKGASLAEREAG